jgi:DNA invertase Pin-like site-specific DNA recombinase
LVPVGVLYARVSTDQQTSRNQLRELRAVAERMGWVVVEEYVDHGLSGANDRDKRPAFDRMLTAAVRREFDVLAAWSVDRLGRSLQHLVRFLDEIHSKRIDLYLHQQGIDTTTPAGKALFQMCGVFAEFERSMIQERVKAGLARARARGKVTLPRFDVQQIMQPAGAFRTSRETGTRWTNAHAAGCKSPRSNRSDRARPGRALHIGCDRPILLSAS